MKTGRRKGWRAGALGRKNFWKLDGGAEAQGKLGGWN